MKLTMAACDANTIAAAFVGTAFTVAYIYAATSWARWRYYRRATNRDADKPTLATCSFCGKNQDEVRKLIAGPQVYICDECIDLCNDIIAEECKAEDHATRVHAAPAILPWMRAAVVVLLVALAYGIPRLRFGAAIAWPIALVLLHRQNLAGWRYALWLALVIGGTVALYFALQ